MKNHIKVSVIIAIYNVGKYLPECLESVINQTLREIEIICVNDCSTDNCLDILNKYAENDNRMRIITLPRNTGSAAEPRNVGIRAAKGEYLSIIDGDDFLELTMYEEMYAQAISLSSDLITCDFKIYDTQTGDVTEHDYWNYRTKEKEFLTSVSTFCAETCPVNLFHVTSGSGAVWAWLIDRELVERNRLGFVKITPFDSCDDVHFAFLLMSLAKRISRIDKAFYYYRKGIEASQCVVKADYLPQTYINLLLKLWCDLRDFDKLETVKRSLLNYFINSFEHVIGNCNDYDVFAQAVSEFKFKVWNKLGVKELPQSYFEYGFVHKQINKLCGNNLEQYLFDALLLKRTYPFGRFEIPPSMKNRKVVIFGAGDFGNRLFFHIKRFNICNVVLWVDTYRRDSFIRSPNEIRDCEYDWIIIAAYGKDVAEAMKAALIGINVPSGKIVWICDGILCEEK